MLLHFYSLIPPAHLRIHGLPIPPFLEACRYLKRAGGAIQWPTAGLIHPLTRVQPEPSLPYQWIEQP